MDFLHRFVGDKVKFGVASAQTFGGGPYDLVTSFGCLHDMGDPVGAARHVRDQLGREPQPGRPGLLLVLHVPVRAQRAVTGRRLLTRRAGR
jgi:hypothetical protein